MAVIRVGTVGLVPGTLCFTGAVGLRCPPSILGGGYAGGDTDRGRYGGNTKGVKVNPLTPVPTLDAGGGYGGGDTEGGRYGGDTEGARGNPTGEPVDTGGGYGGGDARGTNAPITLEGVQRVAGPVIPEGVRRVAGPPVELLVYSTLLRTKKTFLTGAAVAPALPALLLCATRVDLSLDGLRLVVDNWISIEIPKVQLGLYTILPSPILHGAWHKKGGGGV